MKKQRLKAVALSTVISAGVLMTGTAAHSSQQTLKEILAVSQSKVDAAKKSQARINRLQDQATDLHLEFKKVNKEIDGLRVYNTRLERQVENQRKKIAELDESIANVTVIQRQIQPLIVTLLDTMEKFIELDAPFKKEERLAAVEKQKANLDNADITNAEKFRQVIELYNIEAEYARKVSTYPDTISINGQDLSVDILSVGRIALFYQTTDGSQTGVWDRDSSSWLALDPGTYKNSVRNGIRMADKKAQNDIITIPVPAAEAAQ